MTLFLYEKQVDVFVDFEIISFSFSPKNHSDRGIILQRKLWMGKNGKEREIVLPLPGVANDRFKTLLDAKTSIFSASPRCPYPCKILRRFCKNSRWQVP